MATILLTGAAGFIGARVAGLLLDQGHRVLGVDGLNQAYDVRLKEWRLRGLEGCEGFEFCRLDITVFRYFTVYGPAGRPDMSLFRFVQWISEGRPVTVYGDGQQSRDFTFVDDVARGTISGLRPAGYEIINLQGLSRLRSVFQAARGAGQARLQVLV